MIFLLKLILVLSPDRCSYTCTVFTKYSDTLAPYHTYPKV